MPKTLEMHIGDYDSPQGLSDPACLQNWAGLGPYGEITLVLHAIKG